jgi:hypothetical protein
MIGELSAAKITSGTLDAARIAAGSITADKVNIGYGTSTSGLTINSTGITATNNNVQTFKLDTNGTATFSGNISGGNLTVGSSPAISGNRMTGSGARILSNGHFALGNSSRSIVLNDTNFFLNGRVVDASNFSISSAPLSFGTSIINDGPTTASISAASKIGYTIIPWTGWSSMTFNYSFSIIPPYTQSTLPSNYQVWNPSNWAAPTPSAFVTVYLGIGFMVDYYTNASDFIAANGNFSLRCLAQSVRYIASNPGFPHAGSSHVYYLNEGIAGWQPISKSGTQTWIANANWNNWFLRGYTSSELEQLVDNNLGVQVLTYPWTLLLNSYNNDTVPESVTSNATFGGYIRNVRAVVTAQASSTFYLRNTSTGINFTIPGSIQNLSVSTILT